MNAVVAAEGLNKVQNISSHLFQLFRTKIPFFFFFFPSVVISKVIQSLKFWLSASSARSVFVPLTKQK